jgi:hypothetical protein
MRRFERLTMMRAAILLFLALPAAGLAETTVTLSRDEAVVSGGEICRFPAGDRENPFKRWLASRDVTCVAAGSVKFPAGKWNVFGRLGGSSLSTAPVLVDGAAAPPTLSLPLAPAATLVLPEGSEWVVYAPRLGTAFPVAKGTGRIAVPAGEDLWLFRVEKSLPVAVILILPVDAGSERTVAAQGAGAFVVGWLRVPESDREALVNVNNIGPPRVRLTFGGPSRDAYPLPPFTLMNGAFMLVRADSAGDAELNVSGRGWLPDRHRVKVAQSISVAEEPLLMRGASIITVNWSAQQGLPELERSIGACDRAASKAPQFEVSISACPTPKGDTTTPPRAKHPNIVRSPLREEGDTALQSDPRHPIDPATCQAIRKESFSQDVPYGVMSAEEIPPGTYRVELRFGKLPPISSMVTALPFQQTPIPLTAAYFTFYGSLTLGDQPLRKEAAIQFRGGGVGFASADTGDYLAALTGPIEADTQINVAACEGAPKAMVFADLPAKGRFDIKIPDNVLTLTVSDTFTRAPIDGATVRYVIMSRRMPFHPIFERMLKTGGGEDSQQPKDASGTLVIRYVPEREIHLTVTKPGYEKKVIEPFSMLKDDKKTIDIQLVPLRGSSGTIISQRPFEDATVLWYSAAGVETEHADVGEDGTFVFAQAHTPDETMAVVSRSHPLWVFRSPDTRSAARGQAFEIRFPMAATREAEVFVQGVNPRYTTHIGLAIGGVIVPPAALRLHQYLRTTPFALTGTGPLPLLDLLETGPIDVILGPTTVLLAGPRLGLTDVMLMETFSTAPRKRLAPGEIAVVFGEK